MNNSENTKLVVNTSTFLAALNAVGHVPKPNHSVAWAKYLFLRSDGRNLELYANNTDTSAKIEIEADVQYYADASVGLPVSALKATLAALPAKPLTLVFGPSAIEGTHGPLPGLVLVSDNARYNLFSEIQTIEGSSLFESKPETKKAFTADLDSLQVVLNNGNRLASHDELKPAMCGIYFQHNDGYLRAIATDSHALYRHESKTIETEYDFGGVIVPIEATQMFQQSIRTIARGTGVFDNPSVTVSFVYTDESTTYPTYTVFECGNLWFKTRTTDARYPKWETVWPDKFKAVAFANYNELYLALKRAELYHDYTASPNWNIENGWFRLYSENEEFGLRAAQRVRLMKADGSDSDLNLEFANSRGVNVQIFTEALKTLDCQRVQVFLPENENMFLVCDADNVNELQPTDWDVQHGVIQMLCLKGKPGNELQELMQRMESRMNATYTPEPVTA